MPLDGRFHLLGLPGRSGSRAVFPQHQIAALSFLQHPLIDTLLAVELLPHDSLLLRRRRRGNFKRALDVFELLLARPIQLHQLSLVGRRLVGDDGHRPQRVKTKHKSCKSHIRPKRVMSRLFDRGWRRFVQLGFEFHR